MKKWAVFFLNIVSTLSLTGVSLASASEVCSFDHHAQSGNLEAQQTPMGQECNLFLAPSDTGKSFRSYLFKSDGMIQIADTYGDIKGNDKLTTGTRVFFVFPRSGRPTAEIISTPDPRKPRDVLQEMQVRLPSGDGVLFSIGQSATRTSDRVLPSISSGEGGIEVLENPVITPANQGGVQIKPGAGSNSIVLDVGYARGNKPAFLNPAGTSTFRDSEDHSCPISNSVLFKKEGAHDTDFAYKTDRVLYAYLKLHCPKNFRIPAFQAPSGAAGSQNEGSPSHSATQP